MKNFLHLLHKKNQIKFDKKQAKLIFFLFSFLLIIDYPVFPLLTSVLEGKNNGCNGYSLSVCAGLMLLFSVFLGAVWCLIWRRIYIIFFMSEDEKIKKRNSKFFFTRIRMKNLEYIDSMCKSKSRASTVMMIMFLCCGILWIFIYEAFELLKIIT